MLAGDTDGRFVNSLTELINLLLAGKFDTEINTIIYGGRLLAMSNKDGEVRPIAVGYTIRRLAAKCANRQSSKSAVEFYSQGKLESVLLEKPRQLFMLYAGT